MAVQNKTKGVSRRRIILILVIIVGLIVVKFLTKKSNEFGDIFSSHKEEEIIARRK
jgi:hypothetical protein